MPTYTYTARNKDGMTSKGSLVASDQATAINLLSEKGLSPIAIATESKKFSLSFDLSKLMKGKVKTPDKVVFTRQLATMINAGVPIVQSLSLLKQQTGSKALQIVLTDIGKKVEGGSTLAKALSDHPKVFSPVYTNMIKAGEAGGILDQVLERLATQQEKDAEIVRKIRGAMIYPGVVTSVTFGAFFFLMTVIVPKLAAIFEDFDADLPIYTKILLGLSNLMVKYGLVMGIALVGIVIAVLRLIKTPAGKKVFDTIALKLPIFGPVIAKVNIARFARTFGSLMGAGLSVIDSLTISAQALGNSLYKAEIMKMVTEVKNGKPLSSPLKQSKLFPALVGQMVSVGEETGQMDAILLKSADFYEKEVDAVVSNLSSIIEPILIVVLGGMVGMIVVSIFGPISQIGDLVDKQSK